MGREGVVAGSGGALALPRSRVYRILLVLVFIALQVGWTYIGWWVDGADWTPP